MSLATEYKLYIPEEHTRAFKLREQLERYIIPANSVDIFLEDFQQEEVRYLANIIVNRKSFIQFLKAVEQEWIHDKGRIPLPAKTVAEAALHIAFSPLLRESLQYYNQEKITSFTIYYDYVSGMEEVIGSIMTAITYMEGKGEDANDKAMIAFIKDKKVLPVGISDKVSEANLAEGAYFASLFKQDPSGKQLIAQLITELTEEAEGKGTKHRLVPYQNKKLVLTGAKFCQDIYESLYRLYIFATKVKNI